MKKIAISLLALSMLANNTAFAQSTNTRGAAAQAGTYNANTFAWGFGLAGLVVLGVVVGITAGAATSSQSTFSH